MIEPIPAAGPQPAAGHAAPDWHRLHPLSPLIQGSSRLAALVPVVAVALYAGGSLRGRIPDLVLVVALIVAAVVRWLVTRWALDGATLRIETGLLRRDSRQLPVSRIQAVDVVRPLLGRVLGVAELRIRLAGSNARSDGRLAYLPEQQADALRARLLAVPRHAEAPEGGLPELPEHPISSLPRRLIISSVLGAAVSLAALATGYAVVALVSGMSAGWLLGTGTGALFAVLLGIAGNAWRRVSSCFGFAVAISPDGIRIRRGLLSTVAETIPVRRIQAVRMEQPLLWRPFGWCRLQVDVAGVAGREEGPRSGGVRKDLLPVGPVAEARHLAQLVLGHAEPPKGPPPRRARLKGPLSYHFLAAGHDQEMAVTSTGRLTKETTWMRLEKLQSVRFIQGPVQRRLGLATVHADAAGKHVHAVFRDRPAGQARALVDELAALSRNARNVSGRLETTVRSE